MRRCAGLVAVLGVVSLGASLGLVPASAQTKPSEAEALLKDKGIRRIGTYLALVEETDLGKMIGESAKLKKAADDAAKALDAVQQQVDQNKQLITNYLQQRRQISAQLARGGLTVEQNNRLVALYNELGDRINLLQAADFTEQLREARSKANQAREAYIEHLLAMRKLADSIEQRYAELADDQEVKAAIEQLSREQGRPYELVESRTFQTQKRSLQRLEDTVLTETIPLKRDAANTFRVSVMINKKHAREMVLDSGSSLICLPARVAAEVGCAPTVSSEDAQLQLADGRIIVAKLVSIPEVRVGKFVLQNVECAVLPESAVGAEPLLGMSFLQNFVFKIDSDRATLTMSRVESGK
jgi:clan AA aspartic protease (TIGR02281 family)